ncbi:DUF2063 domain-containing protein [Legionella sp. W05-934-2]|jgi:hypothetical protein|uniref:HvfC family RiPP maturation protein n=1 Tax=Legionella sp. W05-934-2 TaxID=1198649 RepID=UPI0034626E98
MSDSLQTRLHNLAQTIRGKVKAPSDHPLSLYQSLIHNNLNSVVSPCFPVLQSILDKAQWHALIDRFLQNYHAQHPAYHRVPEQFVEFLSQLDDLPYPFVDELAHYEWLELAVETAELPSAPIALSKPIEETMFKMPPSARFQWYDYPVHLIDPTNILAMRDPTALVVYRPYHQRQIEFMKIDLLACHCLHFLVNEGYTLNRYLQAASKEQGKIISQDMKDSFIQLMHSLHQQSILQPIG